MRRNFYLTLMGLLAVGAGMAQLAIDPSLLREFSNRVTNTEDKTKILESRVQDLASKNQAFGNETKDTPQKIASGSSELSPAEVIDDGTRIKFNITVWYQGDFSGIGSIRPVHSTPVECAVKDFSTANGVYAEGKIYSSDYYTGGGLVYQAAVNINDAKTGALIKKIDLPAQWYSVFETGAYNPSNKKIYVLGYSGTKLPYLAILNPETGTYTDEWFVPCSAKIKTMAFDKNGNLYALVTGGDICKIDLETGEAETLFRAAPAGEAFARSQSLAFDYHTGELFWIFTSDDWETTDLRKINLQNKTVEIISPLPEFGTACAWVESPDAPATAPNTIASITTRFNNNSTTGDIVVKAPATTFSGSSLSGDVSVKITVDGKNVRTLTLRAGQEGKVENHAFGTTGEHKITATVSNSNGSSPEGSIVAYCGDDVPNAVENVTMSVSSDGTAQLKWDPQTKGVHKGYIDPQKVTYRVVRQPDNAEVAKGIKTTSFTQKLPNNLNRYYYEVYASHNGHEGKSAQSNSAVYGDGVNVPFTSAFDEDFFNLCTIYDLDGDGMGFYQTFGAASCTTGAHTEDYVANDWLILPPLNLQPGNYYIECPYSGIGGISDFDITFGNDLTPEAQTQVIDEIRNLPWEATNRRKSRKYFTVKKAGKYYVGFHNFSKTFARDLDFPYATIWSVSVDNGPDSKAPGEVTNASATAFEKGELKSLIKFTAPKVDFDGNTLTSLDRIEVYNDKGRIMGRVRDAVPGTEYTVEDKNAHQGVNTYNIYAFNDYGQGKFMEVSAYVGADIPSYVSSIDYTVSNNQVVTFTWTPPTEVGVNGGYVDPRGVYYNFCRSEFDYVPPYAADELDKGITQTTYKWTEPGNQYGLLQYLYFYGIQPANNMGDGPVETIPIVLGKPYSTPLIESMKGRQFANTPWRIESKKGGSAWSIAGESNGITPSDNDGGMLLFNIDGNEETQQAIITPLFELKDMKEPVVIFDMYHNPSAPASAKLSVQVATTGPNFTPVGSEIAVKAQTAGWQKHIVSLKDYNGLDRVFVGFSGYADSKTAFAIDNIRICDNIPYDIAVNSLNAPDKIEMDEIARFKITVESKGTEKTSDYSVDIYADGVKVASAQGKPLSIGETAELVAEVRPNAANAHKTVAYEARLNMPDDYNDINNSAFANVDVNGSTLPAPKDLKYNVYDDKIDLEWNEPDAAVATTVTDSFEDYEDFAITSQGPWIFYDRDRLYPYGIDGLTYPNMDQPKAYSIWNPSSLNFNDSMWQPRTGKKCLIAFSSSYLRVDGGVDFNEQGDEWLISPKIAGGSIVSFYASSIHYTYPERFEFWVSKTGKEIDDFEMLGEQVYVEQSGWKKYTYTLPEDATYFAIRYVTYGWEGFALMIDDIEYTVGYNSANLKGYNLYHNSMKQNETPLTERNASLMVKKENAGKIGVSAVYDVGESEMVAIDLSDGIEYIVGNGVTMYSENNSVIIKNADGQNVAFYDLEGRLIRRFTATDYEVVSDLAGKIYIVRIGNKSYKIILN